VSDLFELAIHRKNSEADAGAASSSTTLLGERCRLTNDVVCRAFEGHVHNFKGLPWER